MDIPLVTPFSPAGDRHIKKKKGPPNNSVGDKKLGKKNDTNNNPPSKYTLNAPSTKSSSQQTTSRHPVTCDEELYIANSTLIWSVGGVLQKSFDFSHMDQTVHQAIWAHFEVDDVDKWTMVQKYGNIGNTGTGVSTAPAKPPPVASTSSNKKTREKALVILLRNYLRIYFVSGHDYMIKLRFRVKKIWPMDVGILLQREQDTTPQPMYSYSQSASFPVNTYLFSLLHPLSIMKGVGLQSESTSSSLPSSTQPLSSLNPSYANSTVTSESFATQDILLIDIKSTMKSDKRPSSFIPQKGFVLAVDRKTHTLYLYHITVAPETALSVFASSPSSSSTVSTAVTSSSTSLTADFTVSEALSHKSSLQDPRHSHLLTTAMASPDTLPLRVSHHSTRSSKRSSTTAANTISTSDVMGMSTSSAFQTTSTGTTSSSVPALSSYQTGTSFSTVSESMKKWEPDYLMERMFAKENAPNVTVSCVWRFDGSQVKGKSDVFLSGALAASAFTATTLTSEPVLCVLFQRPPSINAHTLVIFSFPEQTRSLYSLRIPTSILYAAPCITAVPVTSSTRPFGTDVLVLKDNGDMGLWIGITDTTSGKLEDSLLPIRFASTYYTADNEESESENNGTSKLMASSPNYLNANNKRRLSLGSLDDEEERVRFAPKIKESLDNDEIQIRSRRVSFAPNVTASPSRDNSIQIVDLQQPVLNRVNVVLKTKSQRVPSVVRVELDFLPRSQIVWDVLFGALGSVLSVPSFVAIWKRWLHLLFGTRPETVEEFEEDDSMDVDSDFASPRQRKSQRSSDGNESDGNMLNEWETFLVCFFSYCLPNNVNSQPTHETNDMDDWSYFLQSGFCEDANHVGVFRCLNEVFGNELTTSLENMKQLSSSLSRLSILFERAKRLNEDNGGISLLKDLPAILIAGHLFYEDAKLSLLTTSEHRSDLGTFLVQLAMSLEWIDWIQYYRNDGVGVAMDCTRFLDSESKKCDLSCWECLLPVSDKQTPPLSSPPSIMEYIPRLLRTGYVTESFLSPEGVFDLFGMNSGSRLSASFWSRSIPSVSDTRKLIKVYRALVSPQSNSPDKKLNGFISCVLAMVSEGLRRSHLDTLPIGLSVPLFEALRYVRNNFDAYEDIVSNMEVLKLVGREDLLEQVFGVSAVGGDGSSLDRKSQTGKVKDVKAIVEEVEKLSEQRAANVNTNASAATNAASTSSTAKLDGTELLNDEIAKLRFDEDLRIKEVQQLLQSCRPVVLKKMAVPDIMDADQATIEHQNVLQQLSHRTFALPLGRGLFTYASATSEIGLVTESFPIPGIQVSARLPPLFNTTQLDMAQFPADSMDWPKFHDGVAAGLSVPPDCPGVDLGWIVSRDNESLDPKLAGFLFAMGLNGHLRHMVQWYSWFILSSNYRNSKHDLTAIGFLLGYAASCVGTMSENVVQLVSLHSRALQPLSSGADMLISAPTQIASLMSIGLLYAETLHRGMAEKMLAEIGRRDLEALDNNFMAYRESYSLAAGLALGFITLGKGDEALALQDLRIFDCLRRYMLAGKQEHFGGGLGSGSGIKRSDSGLGSTSASGPATSNMNLLSATHMETDHINIDVTAPGATLALGLMYLKTNKANIASMLVIPTTLVSMDFVRPDFVLLRILSRNLIMWDSVRGTKEWVMEQVPQFILDGIHGRRRKHRNRLDRSEDDDDDEDDDMEDADVAFASIDESIRDSIIHVYHNIIAGACLSIGLRYAGSANPDAYKVLLHFVDTYISLLAPLATDFASKLIKSIIKTCLDIIVISASLVVAGSGDLELMRRIRKLHNRVNGETNYGNHMASHMALGFLFLGGGAYTLKTSNIAIAALVASLFPKFPQSITDNKFHLQAFRHLWVLAVEARCLISRDVETREAVPVPIEVTVYDDLSANGEEMSMMKVDSKLGSGSLGTLARPTRVMKLRTPCLLPEVALIKSICVKSPRYWSASLDLEGNPGLRGTIEKTFSLIVKRKTGHLSYVEDPRGLRSILSRAFPKRIFVDSNAFSDTVLSKMERFLTTRQDFVQTFSADPDVIAFANHFCQPSSTTSLAAPSSTDESQALSTASFENEITAFCMSILYECLVQDKPEMLSVYLSLYHRLHDYCSSVSPAKLLTIRASEIVDLVWDVKCLDAFYEGSIRKIENDNEPLIRKEFLEMVKVRFEEWLMGLEQDETFRRDLKDYFAKLEVTSPQVSSALGSYLTFKQVPCPSELLRVREFVRKMEAKGFEWRRDGQSFGFLMAVLKKQFGDNASNSWKLGKQELEWLMG